jgi:acetoin utilization protein AcuC
MAPQRLELTARLAESLGLFDHQHVAVEAPRLATDVELFQCIAGYVDAVRRVSEDPTNPEEDRGLGTEDDPAFAGMHEASARLAGGSLLAADTILSGRAVRAVNFSGGMHHAARERASGFCVYNDVAMAIQSCSTAVCIGWSASTWMRITATGRRASSGTIPAS